MALEMQAGRRDDAEQALQRAERHRGATDTGQTRRQAHQLVHGVNLRLLQQRLIRPVDHQAMLGRVDVLPALVMALEMQAGRRDDAEQALQRAERHRGAADAGQTRRFATQQLALEFRGHAVRVGRHRLAQRGGPLRQVQDVRIALLGGSCRQRCRHGRTRCQKALPQEIATTRRDGFDLPVRQEVFRRLLQVPRLFSQIAH